jgi:hypothetical protein
VYLGCRHFVCPLLALKACPALVESDDICELLPAVDAPERAASDGDEGEEARRG